MKKLFIACAALIIGIAAGYAVFTQILPRTLKNNPVISEIISPISQSREVIGFLPYWLTVKADKDYSKYITTLAYFGLTVDADGTIKKLTNPTETEPGWYTLRNGTIEPFLKAAKKANNRLSLVVFSADEDTISALLENPSAHARTLIDECAPLMRQYGFTDLNLDIENVSEASDEARIKFTEFVKVVKSRIDAEGLGTLSIDVSPTALIKKYLINVEEIGKYVDSVIFMTYDFHYPGSYVTGPVAPLGGAGIDSEFDTEVAIKTALKILPPHKIIAGIPLYGYEWETLAGTPRSAVIPGTGIAASNRRIEELLVSCATCSAVIEEGSKESYVSYEDETTGTFHQFYYPDKQATEAKIRMADGLQIGGLALWALGYDGNTILDPLKTYIGNP